MSLKSAIQDAARRMDGFTATEMRVAVSGRSRKSVHNTIMSLCKEGFLRRRCHGIYEIVPGAGVKNGSGPGPGQKRLWKLMKMQARFGITELAMLGELSLDYAKKYLYHLKRLGHIVEVGRTKHPDGIHRVPQYAMVAASRKIEAPQYGPLRKGTEIKAAARAKCLEVALDVVEAIRKGAKWEAVRERLAALEVEISLTQVPSTRINTDGHGAKKKN